MQRQFCCTLCPSHNVNTVGLAVMQHRLENIHIGHIVTELFAPYVVLGVA